MKMINGRNGKAWMLVPLVLFLLLCWVPIAAGQNETSEIALAEAQIVTGLVKRVLLENNVIVVKPDKGAKGAKVEIRVDEQTEFIGIALLENLKKGKRVKVWFTAVEGEKRAVKLEKLLDVGC